jgi:hypothetical protein
MTDEEYTAMVQDIVEAINETGEDLELSEWKEFLDRIQDELSTMVAAAREDLKRKGDT